MNGIRGFSIILAGLVGVLVVLIGSLVYLHFDGQEKKTVSAAQLAEGDTIPSKPLPIQAIGEVTDGIHTATGFREGEGLEVVIANCTACHSSKLVIQNRATREGWESMIQWMQETQNLWDLGPNQDVILSYLAEHYAPENRGRRANLVNIEWYELED